MLSRWSRRRLPLDPEVVANQVLDIDYLPEQGRFEIERFEIEDGIYYTRVGLWYEKGKHSTTNYRWGTHIPVNSKVRLSLIRDDGRRERVLRLSLTVIGSRKVVTFKFDRHAKVPKNEIVRRTFSPTPVDLSRLEEATRANILGGRVNIGMTRYQTLLARGYPPGHRTPDLRSDTWLYWRSRYSSSSIHFHEGRLHPPLASLDE